MSQAQEVDVQDIRKAPKGGTHRGTKGVIKLGPQFFRIWRGGQIPADFRSSNSRDMATGECVVLFQQLGLLRSGNSVASNTATFGAPQVDLPAYWIPQSSLLSGTDQLTSRTYCLCRPKGLRRIPDILNCGLPAFPQSKSHNFLQATRPSEASEVGLGVSKYMFESCNAQAGFKV